VNHVDSTAFVYLEKGEMGGSSITRIELSTRGDVDGISADAFRQAAEETKKGCIVARALGAVPISLEVEFAGV
jgi:osmotically inducible protein OsmC